MVKKTILLDLDDTISCFLPNIIKEYNKIYGTNHMVEDITEWEIPSYIQPSLWTVFDKSNILEYMPLKPRALEIIKKWSKMNIEVVIVTGIEKNTNGYKDKLKWLKNVGLEPYITDLIPTKNKYLVRGDILIDDNKEYLDKWKEYNPQGVAILMTAQHNKGKYPTQFRVNDWDEIDYVVDKIFKKNNWIDN